MFSDYSNTEEWVSTSTDLPQSGPLLYKSDNIAVSHLSTHCTIDFEFILKGFLIVTTSDVNQKNKDSKDKKKTELFSTSLSTTSRPKGE